MYRRPSYSTKYQSVCKPCGGMDIRNSLVNVIVEGHIEHSTSNYYCTMKTKLMKDYCYINTEVTK